MTAKQGRGVTIIATPIEATETAQPSEFKRKSRAKKGKETSPRGRPPRDDNQVPSKPIQTVVPAPPGLGITRTPCTLSETPRDTHPRVSKAGDAESKERSTDHANTRGRRGHSGHGGRGRSDGVEGDSEAVPRSTHEVPKSGRDRARGRGRGQGHGPDRSARATVLQILTKNSEPGRGGARGDGSAPRGQGPGSSSMVDVSAAREARIDM